MATAADRIAPRLASDFDLAIAVRALAYGLALVTADRAVERRLSTLFFRHASRIPCLSAT